MKRTLTLPLLFTGVLSIAGCGGASFLPNSQTSTQTSTQTSSIATVNVVCTPASIPLGGAAQCNAVVSGSGPYSSDVTWTADSGSISGSGVYTAPATVSGDGTVTVTATSKQDKGKSGHGVLKVGNSGNNSSVSTVSVAANPSSIMMGQTATCVATVSGSGNYSTAVSWTATGGTITQSGVFSPSGVGTGTCIATSTQDSTKSAAAPIVISSTSTPVTVTGITVTANPSSISTSQKTTCVANVSGTGAFTQNVAWSATGGTITSGGVFTPSGVGTGTCIATSTQSGYTNVSGQAAINVTGTSGTSTLTVSASTIAFGTLSLNTPATQSITLTATGSTAVTISGATVSGTGFSLSGATLPITLNPNQSTQLFVVFEPTVAGSATGQLKITSNASSGTTALVNLTGTGQGVSYQVNLSWNAPASSADPVAGYAVFRAPTGTAAFQQLNTSAVTATNYADGTVQNGTTYDYVVRSVDATGAVSDPSNTFTATIPQ